MVGKARVGLEGHIHPMRSPSWFSEELRNSVKRMGIWGNRKGDETKNKLSFFEFYKGLVLKSLQKMFTDYSNKKHQKFLEY